MVEGLCARRQAAENDPLGERVSTPLPVTRFAEGLHSHSILRLPGSAAPTRSVATLPSIAGRFSAPTFAAAGGHGAVALSAMQWSDESHRKAPRRPARIRAGVSTELQLTARECGSVVGWLCAPARLVQVCPTQACGRFPGHHNKLRHVHGQCRRLPAILRLIITVVTTGPDRPVRADDPIRNT